MDEERERNETNENCSDHGTGLQFGGTIGKIDSRRHERGAIEFFSRRTRGAWRNDCQRVRRIDEKLGTYTAILADLQGPKLRIGELEEGSIELTKGAELLIRTGTEKGSEGCVYTNYTQFAQDVKPGEPVLMDDGKLELRVLETDGKSEVRCEVIHGGTLKPRKGINLPSTQISLALYHGKGRRSTWRLP